MSVYSKPGKGWRYDFTLKGQRHTEAWFKTKTEAKRAEALKREGVLNPEITNTQMEKEFVPEKPTGMEFLELVNLWLDEIQISKSESHYRTSLCSAKKWIKRWGKSTCGDFSYMEITQFLRHEKTRVSVFTANRELRYLRAAFNFGIKRKLISENPTIGIGFFPDKSGRKDKKLPPQEDLLRVIAEADPDTQDYLWVLALTGARVGEVNQMVWEDVNFEKQVLNLWTCKTKNGERRPREIHMAPSLNALLLARHEKCPKNIPWVFWHTYWDSSGQRHCGPYKNRKGVMASLCKKAGVRYFSFHPIRHLAASLLDSQGVPIGSIQRILGHQNRTTTELYIHSLGKSEKEAALTLENTYGTAVQDMDLEAPRNTHRQFWKRKVMRPSLEQLKKDIQALGYRGTGNKYGVSDNAVRNWVQHSKNMQANISGKAATKVVTRQKSHTDSHTEQERG